jgi:hypothetical protein
VQYVRLMDRAETGRGKPGPLDWSAFEGTWLNTNWQTQGIAKVVLSFVSGGLQVRVFATGPGGLIDWGPVAGATVYCSGIESNIGSAFSVAYDFGFLKTRLEGNINRGVLVLAAYNAFDEQDGRLNYFSREYFSRVRAA